MCAISGSFSKSKLHELYKLNAYRGESSYSLTTFEADGNYKVNLGVMYQDKGGMPDVLIQSQEEKPGRYFLAHSQAPTTQTNNMHPASYSGALLWHNGIIKQKVVNDSWDTYWLLTQVLDYGWSSLSRVDGTFACVMYNENKLYYFRNEISPLFIDGSFNLSSTKFEGSSPVEPNTVFCCDLSTGNVARVYKEAIFDTRENPYYMENV